MRLRLKLRVCLYHSCRNYSVRPSHLFWYAIEHLRISEYIAEGYEGDAAGDIRKKALFGGDLGLGFDLGLTYYPKRTFSYSQYPWCRIY
jgi:hypothetical protein